MAPKKKSKKTSKRTAAVNHTVNDAIGFVAKRLTDAEKALKRGLCTGAMDNMKKAHFHFGVAWARAPRAAEDKFPRARAEKVRRAVKKCFLSKGA
jgi:hypothetical protein